MRRDDELNRLIRYAQGMGMAVHFKPYKPHSKDEAEWAIDGTELTVYVRPKTSKIEKILSLIHELGHHKSFIDDNRKLDPKIEEALDSEEKRHRKRILDMEINDSVYWEDIYKDTNCQFNIQKLYKQKELDIWVYEVYYETGNWPTSKEKAQKRKELKKKYGC